MRTDKFFCVLISFTLLTVISVVNAAEPDVKQLLQATDNSRGGGLAGVEWMLRITADDPDLGEDMREMWVRAAGTNSVAETTIPKRASGSKLLQLDRNMWYGRPGLSKPISISNRQKLAGPASNGDIASTNYVGDYDAKLLREDKFGDESVWVLELLAKSHLVTYDRIEYWVSQSRPVALRADFFTVSGKLFKTAEIESDNVLELDGIKKPFVSRIVITDAIQTDTVSILEYSDVKLVRVPRHQLAIESLVN